MKKNPTQMDSIEKEGEKKRYLKLTAVSLRGVCVNKKEHPRVFLLWLIQIDFFSLEMMEKVG